MRTPLVAIYSRRIRATHLAMCSLIFRPGLHIRIFRLWGQNRPYIRPDIRADRINFLVIPQEVDTVCDEHWGPSGCEGESETEAHDRAHDVHRQYGKERPSQRHHHRLYERLRAQVVSTERSIVALIGGGTRSVHRSRLPVCSVPTGQIRGQRHI